MDYPRSAFRFELIPCGVIVNLISMKQSYIIESTMEVEYVTTSKATKEVIWLRKFLMVLRVDPLGVLVMILFYNDSGIVAQSKDPKNF